MVDEEVSLAIVDVTNAIDQNLNMEILDFLLCCKDKGMVEIFIDEEELSINTVNTYRAYIDDITDSIKHVLPEYEYTPSFTYDDTNLFTPNRSFTIDRVLSTAPFKIMVLLRGGRDG